MAHQIAIQFYRGILSGLPTLGDGEPGWTTDSHILYIGQGGVNYAVGTPTGAAGGDLTGTYPNPTIENDKVTWAKIQNISAPNRLVGKGSTGSVGGDPEEITLGSGLSMSGTVLSATGGGTPSPLTTKGDLYTYSTTNARLAVGVDDYVLIADSSQTTGLRWSSTVNRNEGSYAASGSTQGTATLITTSTAVVSGADGTVGVILPSTIAAAIIVIQNTDTFNSLKVYPNSGATIDVLMTDANDVIVGNGRAVYFRISSILWIRK